MQPYLFHPKKKTALFFSVSFLNCIHFSFVIPRRVIWLNHQHAVAFCSIKLFFLSFNRLETVVLLKIPKMYTMQRNSLISKWYGSGSEFDEKHSMITSISWLNKLIYYVCASVCDAMLWNWNYWKQIKYWLWLFFWFFSFFFPFSWFRRFSFWQMKFQGPSIIWWSLPLGVNKPTSNNGVISILYLTERVSNFFLSMVCYFSSANHL